jgi:hypothetical protein
MDDGLSERATIRYISRKYALNQYSIIKKDGTERTSGKSSFIETDCISELSGEVETAAYVVLRIENSLD